MRPADELVPALWEITRSARWYQGRSRDGRPVGAEVSDWFGGQDVGVRSAVLTVAYPDGAEERYHIPLAPGDEVVDACDSPAAAGQLLDLLADGAPGFERHRPDVPTGLPGRRYTGEQSNTSLFFGDQVMGKVFRRLEDGPSVEVELVRALAGTGATAEPYGVWRSGDTDLAIFVEALADPTDGYVAACEHVADRRDFGNHARALGETLARVHHTLAERLRTSTGDGATLASTFRQRLDEAAVEVADLQALRPAIVARYTELDGLSFGLQRVHGDCHLGQTLLTEGTWRYVDFEGEPLKTLAERREPDVKWRDVAGMLRSFDYAAATASGSDPWRDSCREAFLTGYTHPDAEEQALLDAFEVDKAVYEVIYEARNRPHLIDVPLGALHRLTGC